MKTVGINASQILPAATLAIFPAHPIIAVFVSPATNVTKTCSHAWNFLYCSNKDKY